MVIRQLLAVKLAPSRISFPVPSNNKPPACVACDTTGNGQNTCISSGIVTYGSPTYSCMVIVGLSTSNTLAFTIRTYIANCADAYDTLTFDGTLIRVHCCQTDLCNYVNVSFVIESTTSNATYSPDQADSGLSGGAIAGIVIGVVAAVVIAAIIIGCILYFCSHRRTTTAAPRKESQKAIYTIPRNNRQNPGGRYEDDYHQSSPRNYRQNQDVQYEDDYHQPSPRNYRQDTDVIIVDDYHPVSPRNYYQNGGIQYDDD
ncbi:unnamed protein product [Didymodactylos carnosus]|uniref:Uncharacterized protein n=1 Tax=Didymodactylos carnosus TaxID=1234261 RepID=A0A8S2H7F1_9BILA|nr:unnamed protein product [Didymodactylos carnosus]CAF3588057.1 unnamed protein product [Didymodactylos carnosus]